MMYHRIMDEIFEKLPENLRAALADAHISTATAIQREAMPPITDGMDVIALAPTGSGKTLAYVLPILRSVDPDGGVQALVLCPTRELAMQIGDVFRSALTHTEGIRTAVLYGGENFERQLYALRKKPHVVVGTVGRILDHIERKTLKIKSLRTLVLDEGDVMLKMGFVEDVRKIIAKIDTGRQNLLFSATLPGEIAALCNEMMKDPVRVGAEAGEDRPDVGQHYVIVNDSRRVGCLLKIVAERKYRRYIVFCNTRFRAERVHRALVAAGTNAVLLHGEMDQKDRTRAMAAFRKGEAACLVGTDVAARGIDIPDLQAVFNLDPPGEADSYVHRIGRTARASRRGEAYTFVAPEQTVLIGDYARKTGIVPEHTEVDLTDCKTYTLPADSSDKHNVRTRAEASAAGERFFLNVGKRDMLDKATLTKLVATVTDIPPHKITDVKIRDTYSFVQVTTDVKHKMGALKGIDLGARRINVQPADSSKEFAPKADRKDAGASKRKDAAGKKDRLGKESKRGERSGKKDARQRGEKASARTAPGKRRG